MDHLVDLGRGFNVGLVYVAVQTDMADYFDVVADMVKQQQRVAEHEHRLRHAHRVF